MAISQKLRIWTWNSLLEDGDFIETPYFFKQILWGCFGLRTASEVKSDLIIGFFLANFPYPQNFRSLGHPHGLQKLVDENENENEKNRQLLYLRNSFAAAGKNVNNNNGKEYNFNLTTLAKKFAISQY